MDLFADFEQLNYIHRFAGVMLVLLSNIHAVGYSESDLNVLLSTK